jgi:hypothetical protein
MTTGCAMAAGSRQYAPPPMAEPLTAAMLDSGPVIDARDREIDSVDIALGEIAAGNTLAITPR